jgi:hypothetical protein
MNYESMLQNLHMENVIDTDISLEHSTRVEKSIQHNLNAYYQDKTDIERRLQELDEEWDIERTLQLAASSLSITGLLLGTTNNKKWLSLPVVASSFLMSHALFGWCPPLLVLRALGFRNRAEIDKEKFALKALRGDFEAVLPVPNSVWGAVNR